MLAGEKSASSRRPLFSADDAGAICFGTWSPASFAIYIYQAKVIADST